MSYFARLKWQEPALVSNPLYANFFRGDRKGSVYRNELESTTSEDGVFSVGIKMDLPIEENFQYQVKSNFQNMSDTLSGISGTAGSLINLLQTFNKLGVVGGGNTGNVTNFLNFQVWDNTEPFRLSMKILLHTKTDPFIDVYIPAMSLTLMGIISSTNESNTQFRVPGINFKALRLIEAENAENTTSQAKDPSKLTEDDIKKNFKKTSNKILTSFAIVTEGGGFLASDFKMLEINGAFVETAIPTWSEFKTESGIPLWCEMDVTIQSIYSAYDKFFKLEPAERSTGLLNVVSQVATNIFR